MTAQIIEIAGKKMAILPEDEYRKLLDAVDEQSDLRVAERAERRRHEGEEYLPAELVDRLMGGENALRVWRNYRGMSAAGLSKASGVEQSRISELENGKAQGKPATWRALADALNVTVDDILPID
ncbi:helix-turn-helix transcriptional regulator [Novosphingobium sp. NPDC080210]|jgi:DNA-binding XRE family transcriptional regulator|uniref:helix-turn-helix transcriptional regulator n=1 Tax=Novosphingobium sp. NPDC080210 TaxID=3390596 RepID=UPI003D052704